MDWYSHKLGSGKKVFGRTTAELMERVTIANRGGAVTGPQPSWLDPWRNENLSSGVDGLGDEDLDPEDLDPEDLDESDPEDLDPEGREPEDLDESDPEDLDPEGPEPEDLPVPGVYIVEINGRLPCLDSVRQIKQAVRHVPDRYLRPWLAAGGRLEIIYGDDVRVSPKFRGRSEPALGMNRFSLCVVAGDHDDAARTALHELGHAVDRITGSSRSEAWLKIWHRDLDAGDVPDRYGQQDRSEEYFADCFAQLWSDHGGYLTDDARDFIAFGVA